MDSLFGFGPLEIIAILIIALLVLGPKDMSATARRIGLWINKLVRSPIWREVMNTTRDIRDLPTKIVRDAGLNESLKDIKESTQGVLSQVRSELRSTGDEVRQSGQEAADDISTAIESENTIAPPVLLETYVANETPSEPEQQALPVIEPAPEIPEGSIKAPTSDSEQEMPVKRPRTRTRVQRPAADAESAPAVQLTASESSFASPDEFDI